MKLTEKQRQCLEHVAKADRPQRQRRSPPRLTSWRWMPPFKITTVESLARKGLVEHTSLGWRLTLDGRLLLKALKTP